MVNIHSKSFKFKVILSKEQEQFSIKTAGCCRFIFNKGLDIKKNAWEKEKKKISRFDLDKLITAWKKELIWLTEPPSQVLQQVNKDLDQAFNNFFKGAGYPNYKKKHFHDSFRIPQNIKLEKQLSKKRGQVKIPKLGIVRFIKTREIEGKIRNITFSKEAGEWYISFNSEIKQEKIKNRNYKAIGIDRGIKVFAQCSSGKYYIGINPLKKNQKKIVKFQKKLSKKKKFSSNWQKLKLKLSKLHRYVANIRKDYLHKISKELAESQSVIVMENLKVVNMSKSAKGSKKKPGKNVKVKSALNKSILDQGWSMFQTFLNYKLNWSGGKLILINPKNTSITCSNCGDIDKENRKSQEEFYCIKCRHTENADLNASKTILAEGLFGHSLWSYAMHNVEPGTLRAKLNYEIS